MGILAAKELERSDLSDFGIALAASEHSSSRLPFFPPLLTDAVRSGPLDSTSEIFNTGWPWQE